jgi:hypothetical protein
MSDAGDEQTQRNNPGEDGPPFYGKDSEHLPADIRALAFPDNDHEQVLLWTNNLVGTCRLFLLCCWCYCPVTYLVMAAVFVTPLVALAIFFIFFFVAFLFWGG